MTEDRRHLVLVGLMGAGKTTVGMRCAELLGRSFVDTDSVVECATGKTVAEIFFDEGEARFRELERDAVADVCASPEPLVIGCGGGAVLDPTTRRRLRAVGLVVWLQASPPVLATLRAPAYEAASDVVVETDGREVDEVADAVIGKLRAWRG